MIYLITDLPPKKPVFIAAWELSPIDFEKIVVPDLYKHVEKKGQVNFPSVQKYRPMSVVTNRRSLMIFSPFNAAGSMQRHF